MLTKVYSPLPVRRMKNPCPLVFILLFLWPLIVLGEFRPMEAAQHKVATQDENTGQAQEEAREAKTRKPAAQGDSAQPQATVKKKKKGALADAVQARTPEEQAKQSGFQFITQLNHSLGAGIFVDPEMYSFLAGTFTVVPQYLFGIGNLRLVATANARLLFEYTLADNVTGRKVSFFDTRLNLIAPALLRDKKFTGIAVSPSIGLTIPTSLESWNAGMLTALNARVVFSRSVKSFDFRLIVGASKGFYTSAQAGVRASEELDASGNLYVTCRTGEAVCGFSNFNPAWSVNVGGQAQWRVTGHVLLYAGYTYLGFWRYGATYTRDAFTPQAVDSNGNPVADVGLGYGDLTSTFVGVSYQMNAHYAMDLGVSTMNTPLHPTGQARFPFLSIGTWADNTTRIYFSVTAAY